MVRYINQIPRVGNCVCPAANKVSASNNLSLLNYRNVKNSREKGKHIPKNPVRVLRVNN